MSKRPAFLVLADDWKCIAKRAWSFRLGALAMVFYGLEVVVPLFSNEMPRNIFAGLSFVVAAGAMWARLVDQSGVK